MTVDDEKVKPIYTKVGEIWCSKNATCRISECQGFQCPNAKIIADGYMQKEFPDGPETFGFEEALNRMMDGKYVRRQSWDVAQSLHIETKIDLKTHKFNSKFIIIFKNNDEKHPMLIEEETTIGANLVMATDWEEVV